MWVRCGGGVAETGCRGAARLACGIPCFRFEVARGSRGPEVQGGECGQRRSDIVRLPWHDETAPGRRGGSGLAARSAPSRGLPDPTPLLVRWSRQGTRPCGAAPVPSRSATEPGSIPHELHLRARTSGTGSRRRPNLPGSGASTLRANSGRFFGVSFGMGLRARKGGAKRMISDQPNYWVWGQMGLPRGTKLR